ncbi:MAG: hypothetical protein NZ455_15800 [Bacteroidia bacterium]|nr:hypothetical protein [Bacteroidia bacterium]
MRSVAKHRSDSAARSTPTRAQRGTRPKKQKIKLLPESLRTMNSCFETFSKYF